MSTPTALTEIPELAISARGEIISSTFPLFAEKVRARLAEINRDLTTDEDFDQAALDAKAIASAEAALQAAKAKALADAEQLHALFEQIDGLTGELSKARLDLSKQITKRKDERKAELLADASKKLVCAQRHRKGFDAVLADSIKGKKSFDNMESALNATVTSYNSLIEKSRGMIDSFVAAHGSDLVMDREDLEIKAPDVVEGELRRRFEKKKDEDEKKRLAEDARKAREDAAAAQKALAESEKPPAPPVESPAAAPVAAAPEAAPVAQDAQASTAPQGESAAEEWARFKTALFAALAPVKALREAMKHEANVLKAEKFSTAVGAAWKEVQ